MSDWTQEYDRLIDEMRELPYSVEGIGLLEAAIKLADSHNDVERAFRARKALLSEATYSGHPERALVAFGWLLAVCDDEETEYESEDVLWQYKWVLSSLPEFPKISLEQIETSLEDFRKRLLDCGCSLKTYWSAVEGIKRSVGDVDGAAHAIEQMNGSERDHMSDCKACVINSAVCAYAFFEQHEDALRRAEPLLSGEESCASVPHETYGTLLFPAMVLGKWDKAKDFYETGYDLTWQSPSYISSIGRYLEYLGCTRKLDEGFSMLVRHLPWYVDSKSGSDRSEFLIGALVLMDALVEFLGEEASVTCEFPEGFELRREENSYTTIEMQAFFEKAVSDLDAQFDKRNGNDFFSEDSAHRRKFRANFGPPELYGQSDAEEETPKEDSGGAKSADEGAASADEDGDDTQSDDKE